MFNYYDFNKETALSKYSNGDKVELLGICKSNLFESEDNDYAVYNFELEEGDNYYKDFKVQGSFQTKLINGQTYKLSGKVINYKGENQCRVYQYFLIKPVNKKGIIAYLQTLQGLKKKAELIYDEFGDDCINILLKEPLKVANSIKGIGVKSVNRWQSQLKELENSQETIIKLLEYGISPKNANNLIKEFGDNILNVIERNPYLLMNLIKGYGFLRCDNVALNTDLLPNDANRIKSSVTYVLEENASKGHCYLPFNELVDKIKNLLSLKLNYIEMNDLYNLNKSYEKVLITKYNREYEINIKDLKNSIDNYNKQQFLADKNDCRYIYHLIDEEAIINQIDSLNLEKKIINEDGNIYLKRLFFAEIGFAKNIKRLSNYRVDYKKALVEKILNKICKEEGYELEEKQKTACIDFNLSKQGVYILNGSAGTGKTFTLNLILKVAKELSLLQQDNILAVAPTGKASKVASKSINMECLTIHRALGYNPMQQFSKNEENPFTQDVIVCDEGSMLDIELAHSFVKAIKTGSKLIIMGDIKQLASVGAGNVLKDLIEHSETLDIKNHYTKVITLDVIKRQGLLSGIVKNANRIINDEMIFTENETKDFFVQKKNTVEEVKTCVINSIKRLLTYPNYTLEDIQVLIPQRTGALGVNVFNYILQQTFNPYNGEARVFKTSFEAKISDTIKEYNLYIQKGDKVMHIKNNYDLKLYDKDMLGNYVALKNISGITNGETGVVYDILKTTDGFKVIVKYENYYVFYEDGVEELELSYATTIHKSQGSAWKAIILPIVSQHSFMLSNNLIYTGITRARDFCTIIGDSKSIMLGIKTHKDLDRYSGLQTKLA